MTVRPRLLAAVALGISLVPSSSFALPAGEERPNVLMILADDLGYSDLGCYGSEIPTPNLDRLAAGGVRFTQCTNTSKCFPSRASLLTGCYAQAIGMDRSPAKIVGAPTIGELLREAGYRTLFSGKHHGTENPYDRGFDRYFGLRDGACNYFNPGLAREGEPAPAQKRKDRAWCVDGETLRPFTPTSPDFYTTDAFTDAALGWLEEYAEEERPFFLYVSYNAPHDPLQAPQVDIDRHVGVYEAGYEVIRGARWMRQREMGMFGEGVSLSEEDHPEWSTLPAEEQADQVLRMQVYAAMVDRMDRNIGRLITKLEQLGELDNTLILFASDNGGSAEIVKIGKGEIGNIDRWSSLGGRWANVSNTPLRKYKNHSFEGGICTPLIVHGPGIVGDPGGFIREPCHLFDLVPTFLELGAAERPDTWSGERAAPLAGTSLVPLLEGKPFARTEPIFYEWGRGRAVRDGRWKLVTPKKGAPWELYDLEKDRVESVDVAAEHPEVVTRLAGAWDRWREAVNQ